MCRLRSGEASEAKVTVGYYEGDNLQDV